MEREVLKSALTPGAQCLSLEQLGRYADGALPADEQKLADTHLHHCLNCQAELALLQAVTSGAVRNGEADIVRDGVKRLEARAGEIFVADRVQRPSPRRWLAFRMLPVAAMAAVLLIGVAIGAFYFSSRQRPPLPGSVTTGDETTRSLAIAVRGPVGDRVDAPQTFEWVAVDRAVRYRVRLTEVDRREVWSMSTSAVAVDLPDSVRTSMAPGRTLLWDVTAYDASGAIIAESGRQSFRVLRR